jgi:heme oxygenase
MNAPTPPVAPSRAAPRPADSRIARLREGTLILHARLDEEIQQRQAFSSLQQYRGFLRLQQAFHHRLACVYADATLNEWIPDLALQARAGAVDADLAQLGEDAAVEPAVVSTIASSLGTRLGWLYVAEGSTLGAAVLLKQVAALGLSDQHGARHMAAHADGRAAHWRWFMGRFDAVVLDAAQEAEADAGALEAFEWVRALVREHLA